MLGYLQLFSLLAYGGYWLVHYKRGFGQEQLTWFLLLCLLLHGSSLFITVNHSGLGFFAVLSMASWTCLALILLIKRAAFVNFWLVPIAIVAQGLNTYLHNSYNIADNNQFALVLHVAISIASLALSLVTLLLLIYYRIKYKQLRTLTTSGLGFLPSLETMQKLVYQLLYVCLIVLGTGIATGLVFIEDFFGQHLAHKTFFSLVAFIILGYASAKHIKGRLGLAEFFWCVFAVNVLLFAGYFGSRFVLEFIL